MVIVNSPSFSYTAPWNNAVIDGPLDFLFALDVLTSNPPEGLEGILDTDRVGVAGYSSDGFFSLALGGARINPSTTSPSVLRLPTWIHPSAPSGSSISATYLKDGMNSRRRWVQKSRRCLMDCGSQQRMIESWQLCPWRLIRPGYTELRDWPDTCSFPDYRGNSR